MRMGQGSMDMGLHRVYGHGTELVGQLWMILRFIGVIASLAAELHFDVYNL